MSQHGRSDDVESGRNVRPRHAPPDDEIEEKPWAHVDDFVRYCKGELSADASDTEKRRNLLRLLCRQDKETDENRDIWHKGVLRAEDVNPGAGEPSLNNTPHWKHTDRAYDIDSKMARIANALRNHHQQANLGREDEQKVLEIPGWSETVWKEYYWNCRCEACNTYQFGCGL